MCIRDSINAEYMGQNKISLQGQLRMKPARRIRESLLFVLYQAATRTLLPLAFRSTLTLTAAGIPSRKQKSLLRGRHHWSICGYNGNSQLTTPEVILLRIGNIRPLSSVQFHKGFCAQAESVLNFQWYDSEKVVWAMTMKNLRKDTNTVYEKPKNSR
eukprot:TRINITY_DN31494_c0_g1_i2.p1 TRINITY_DN31494_c0_g1~~TRINITY_DN31494_c0_g1_i2.p1  ORF type:complete len:177 (-),score=23.96 TRINITY_DN31494_c0_g1_i2:631-1101(-)